MIKNRVDAHRGFTPASVGPQNAIDPEPGIRYHRSAQGCIGGQAPFPPSSYLCIVFHSITKTFLQSLRRDKEVTLCC